MLKITNEDYNALERSINEVLRRDPGLISAGISAGHSDTRIRWDLYHRSALDKHDLYKYLDDNNIDSALRRIIPINRD